MSGFAALLFGGILLLVLGPPLFTDDADAERLGYFGRDYEGELCGQIGRRDLRDRPFVYFLQPHNLSSAVCVRACPLLADELACDYAFEAAPTATKRGVLGRRCFAAHRTRAHSLACLPVDPALAATADAWMSRHVLDELAAQTLQASGVIFGAWAAAAAASVACLLLLRWLPHVTLLLLVLGALGLSVALAATLLSRGGAQYADARAPVIGGEAVCSREVAAAQLQEAAGWLALALPLLLVLALVPRARNAHLAAGVLDCAARPLAELPALSLLPLYLFVPISAALAGWFSTVVYLAAPSPFPAPQSAPSATGVWLWPLALAFPIALGQLLLHWQYIAVAGAVAAWFHEPEHAAAAAARERAAAGRLGPLATPPTPDGAPSWRLRWALWRSGWLALGHHFGELAAAACLLPAAGGLKLLLPPVHAAPRRDASPYARAALGTIQGALRVLGCCCRNVDGGALVQLVLHGPIGGSEAEGGPRRNRRMVAGATVGSPLTVPDPAAEAPAPAASEGGDAEAPVSSRPATPKPPPERLAGLLSAGARCERLYLASAGPLRAARSHTLYFLALGKWVVAGGCGLGGALTIGAAPPSQLLWPLWPTLVIVAGAYLIAAAAFTVAEAASEAVVQCYCEEALQTADDRQKEGKGGRIVGSLWEAPPPANERAKLGGSDQPTTTYGTTALETSLLMGAAANTNSL